MEERPKGIASLICISSPRPLFLWRSSRTAAHPGVLCGLLVNLDSGNFYILAAEKSQQFSDF